MSNYYIFNNFKLGIKPDVADICVINSPSYKARTIIAAFSLNYFAACVSWVHLEKVGTAYGACYLIHLHPGTTSLSIHFFVA